MLQNGWKKFERANGGGAKYSPYQSRMVVIVSGKKTPIVYLMPPVLSALKNPERVDVYTRGSNVALFASEDKHSGYKVTQGDRGSNRYVTLAALVKTWNISPGVYDVWVEDDHVVFDTQQKPSAVK